MRQRVGYGDIRACIADEPEGKYGDRRARVSLRGHAQGKAPRRVVVTGVWCCEESQLIALYVNFRHES